MATLVSCGQPRDPPKIELRYLFAWVIRNGHRTCRVQPNRAAQFCDQLKNGEVLRPIERLAVNAGHHLDPGGAKLANGSVRFGESRVRIIQRQCCYEGWKTMRMHGRHRGHRIVGYARQLGRVIGTRDMLRSW